MVSEGQGGITLTGQPGELRFTLEIKRAATGEVETYEMIGVPLPEEEETE
jgi:hypothetical protein